MSVIRTEKNRSSRTWAASTLFYIKRSRVSWIRAKTGTDTGEEKGQVKFLYDTAFIIKEHFQIFGEMVQKPRKIRKCHLFFVKHVCRLIDRVSVPSPIVIDMLMDTMARDRVPMYLFSV